MSLHPNHPIEQRARELDAGWLRRIRTLPLHMLKTERAAHCRLYHFGDDYADSCWRCRAIERRITRLLKVPA